MLWVSRDEAEGIHRRQVTWNLFILGGSNHFTEGLQGRVERLGRQWDLTSVSWPGSPQLHSRCRWNLVQCMVGVGASLVTQTVKNLPAMQETPHSILGLGRSPGEGNGNLLQYSCLEDSMDRGAWQAMQFMGLQRVEHNWELLTLSLSRWELS